MTLFVFYACMAGILIGLSRQLNGRLSLSTSPLIASFWNHAVGFGFLTIIGLSIGGLIPGGAFEAPWYAYLGGPVGVVFVASGSWLITRIGATNTALMIIGGQMSGGVAINLLQSATSAFWLASLGVVLIMSGMVISQRRTKG
ncbi:DMT family transporter [Pararhizobium sp. DWP3-4]|uniref:DMT family transporter n=1 Tax=unclassified Pararhizobium TaxID=2643050 RepID=UPI003CE91720